MTVKKTLNRSDFTFPDLLIVAGLSGVIFGIVIPLVASDRESKRQAFEQQNINVATATALIEGRTDVVLEDAQNMKASLRSTSGSGLETALKEKGLTELQIQELRNLDLSLRPVRLSP